MRIVHLSSQRAFYGGEVHLRDLAVALRDRGHVVHVIAMPGSALARELAAAGVATSTIRLRDWYEPWGMFALRRALRRLQPDILHAHSPRDYYMAAMATLGMPSALVGTRHRLEPIAFPRLKAPFLHRVRAMIAVSQAVSDGLLATRWPACRVVTIPNGVGTPPVVAPAAIRAELGLAADDLVIGYVGRLCPSKGVATLVEAVAAIHGLLPGLRLAIVGADSCGGAYRRELEGLVARLGLNDVACFLGYRHGADRLSAAFDVQVVPSRAEPFGLVTIEALARGVPVVATVSGGSREIIRDGREGLLVPPDDARALARALRRILSDRALRLELGARGRVRVAACFTHEAQVVATERVYQIVRRGLDVGAIVSNPGDIGVAGAIRE